MNTAKINRYNYKEPSWLMSVLDALTYAAILTILNLAIAATIMHLL